MMINEFAIADRDEKIFALERDVWTMNTLIDNVLRDAHLLSEEDILTLFVMGTRLTETFGEQETEDI